MTEATLEEVDRKLHWLRDSVERIGANLLELELNPDRRLLEESTLAGQTATRWAATSAAIMQLWQSHELLRELVERAVKLRGTKSRVRAEQLARLHELLEGPSIEASSTQVPLAHRGLLSGSQTALRSSPDELLAQMSAAFDEAKALIVAVAGAWDTFVPRLRAARIAVTGSAEVARGLGEDEPPQLASDRKRLAALAELLANDPLSVTPAEVEALEASVESVRRDLDDLADFKRQLAQRLDEGRDLLEQLRGAERQAETAHRDALLKITAPAVPEPHSAAAHAETELAQVVTLSESGAGREARDALEAWMTRTRMLLEQARSVAADNRAPIDERNQLRGRLDAYRAKAKALGLIEDPELSELFERANLALHNAPSDLASADTLVRRCQEILSAHPRTQGGKQ